MTDTVTVSAPTTYRRWSPPNFASLDQPPRRREEGLVATAATHVKDLTPEALDALAGAWLEDLYFKTGRPSPWVRNAEVGR